MNIHNIRLYPDEVLREKCEPIKTVTNHELELLEGMLLTMRHSQGIGLAAPQIGITRRLIVADIGERPAVKLINPEIVNVEGTDEMIEGCLSLPDVQVQVRRPFKITVCGLNEHGKRIELSPEGLLARVIQHEVDHLNGKLIVDYQNVFDRIKFYMQKRGT